MNRVCANRACKVIYEVDRDNPSYYCPKCKDRYTKLYDKAFEQRRASADKRGYDWLFAQAKKDYLMEHPICSRCGKPSQVVGHIIPIRVDGTKRLDKTNWTPLCYKCNADQREEDKIKYPNNNDKGDK